MTHQPRSSSIAFASLLLAVRAGRTEALVTTPEGLTPGSEAAAYEVQDEIVRHLGPVVGWKVGAANPEAEPAAAPLHAETVFPNGAIIPADACQYRGVEAEIAYRFARSLDGPPDSFTRTAVEEAIGSIHPVLELIDTRFTAPASQAQLAHLADQQSHGALIVGPACADWRRINPLAEPLSVRIDHRAIVEKIGTNNGGDPIRLLVWLARHAAARGLPIQPGTLVTTGSMSGTEFVPHRTHVSAIFANLGAVSAFLA